MRRIIETLLEEGIDESMIHRVLDLIEEEYEVVDEDRYVNDDGSVNAKEVEGLISRVAQSQNLRTRRNNATRKAPALYANHQNAKNKEFNAMRNRDILGAEVSDLSTKKSSIEKQQQNLQKQLDGINKQLGKASGPHNRAVATASQAIADRVKARDAEDANNQELENVQDVQTKLGNVAQRYLKKK